MKILITGSDGFIAKNLIFALKNRGFHELMLSGHNTADDELKKFALACDAVVHLAGVNRPETEEEFWKTNVGYTKKLITYLAENRSGIHFIYISSIQAEQNNPYGRSKLEAENILKAYADHKSVLLTIYRLPNVFGKWSRPNYNSVVATFCYNISRNLRIQIHDADRIIHLTYIDDVVDALIQSLELEEAELYAEISPVYQIRVGALAKKIKEFRQLRENLELPEVNDDFIKKLYSTYLSFVDKDDLKYPLQMHRDERGSFTEIVRTDGAGQFSVNIIKAGNIKGNHWHNTKVEKFIVLKGQARIKLRNMLTDEIKEYVVSEEKLEVVDIPVGYTHCIMNNGQEDTLTLMWANECFNEERPDTYQAQV